MEEGRSDYSSWWDQLKDRRLFPGSAWVFIIWLLLMTLLPFLIILGMSFLKRSEFGSIAFDLNINNYARCLHFTYLRVFGKTLWLAAMATASCLLIGFP